MCPKGQDTFTKTTEVENSPKSKKLQQYLFKTFYPILGDLIVALQHQSQLVIHTIKRLENNVKSKMQKSWARMIFMNMLFNVSQVQSFTKQRILLFQNLGDQMNLGQQRRRVSSFMTFFSSKKTQPKEEKSESNLILSKIVSEIAITFKKKWMSFEFFKSFSQYKKKSNVINQQQTPKQYSHKNVWKAINYLQSLGPMLNYCNFLAQHNISKKGLRIGTLHLIAFDIIKMYPTVVKTIKQKLDLVRIKHQQISTSTKLSRNIRKKQLIKLYKSNLFTELKNLQKEVQKINIIIYETFNGWEREDLLVQLPDGFIFCEQEQECFEIMEEIQNEFERFKENSEQDDMGYEDFVPKYILSESTILQCLQKQKKQLNSNDQNPKFNLSRSYKKLESENRSKMHRKQFDISFQRKFDKKVQQNEQLYYNTFKQQIDRQEMVEKI